MAKSTQCTIFVAANKEEAWNFNLESTIKNECFENNNPLNLQEQLIEHLDSHDNNKLLLEDFQKMPWCQYYKKRAENVFSSGTDNTKPVEKLVKIQEEKGVKDEKHMIKSNIKEEKQINKTLHKEDEEKEFITSHEKIVNNAITPYTKESFDGVYMRFEEPQSNCRWDSPLFVVYPNDKLDYDAIYDVLFKATPLVPNQSTQNVSCIYYYFRTIVLIIII